MIYRKECSKDAPAGVATCQLDTVVPESQVLYASNARKGHKDSEGSGPGQVVHSTSKTDVKRPVLSRHTLRHFSSSMRSGMVILCMIALLSQISFARGLNSFNMQIGDEVYYLGPRDNAVKNIGRIKMFSTGTVLRFDSSKRFCFVEWDDTVSGEVIPVLHGDICRVGALLMDMQSKESAKVPMDNAIRCGRDPREKEQNLQRLVKLITEHKLFVGEKTKFLDVMADLEKENGGDEAPLLYNQHIWSLRFKRGWNWDWEALRRRRLANRLLKNEEKVSRESRLL